MVQGLLSGSSMFTVGHSVVRGVVWVWVAKVAVARLLRLKSESRTDETTRRHFLRSRSGHVEKQRKECGSFLSSIDIDPRTGFIRAIATPSPVALGAALHSIG